MFYLRNLKVFGENIRFLGIGGNGGGSVVVRSTSTGSSFSFCHFENLGIKDKLNEIDYQKIVIYAIGIAAAYYIGKTILDSLDEAEAVKQLSNSSSSTAKSVKPAWWKHRCNYGRMIFARYRTYSPALSYCNK